jgi:hypothetical protein
MLMSLIRQIILFKNWKHLWVDNVMLTKPEQITIFVAIDPVGR